MTRVVLEHLPFRPPTNSPDGKKYRSGSNRGTRMGVREKVEALLVQHSDKSFTYPELAKRLALDRSSLYRSLRELKSLGAVTPGKRPGSWRINGGQ